MSQEQIIAQRRHPSNDGEKLVASLPGMRIQTHRHPFNFLFTPKNLRIETKHRSSPNVVLSACGATWQFVWSDIASGEFDWLLLTGKHVGEWYLWLLPRFYVRQDFMTLTNGGQITCTVNGLRTPRRKAQEFEYFRVTYEELHTNCLNGALASLEVSRLIAPSITP